MAAPIVAGMSAGAAVLSTAVIAGKPHVIAEMKVDGSGKLAGKTVREVEAAHNARMLALTGSDGKAGGSSLTADTTLHAGSTMTIHVAADGLAAVAAAAGKS